jgi:hypothetical protein
VCLDRLRHIGATLVDSAPALLGLLHERVELIAPIGKSKISPRFLVPTSFLKKIKAGINVALGDVSHLMLEQQHALSRSLDGFLESGFHDLRPLLGIA